MQPLIRRIQYYGISDILTPLGVEKNCRLFMRRSWGLINYNEYIYFFLIIFNGL